MVNKPWSVNRSEKAVISTFLLWLQSRRLDGTQIIPHFTGAKLQIDFNIKNLMFTIFMNRTRREEQKNGTPQIKNGACHFSKWRAHLTKWSAPFFKRSASFYAIKNVFLYQNPGYPVFLLFTAR